MLFVNNFFVKCCTMTTLLLFAIGVRDRSRTCIKRICNPPPNHSVAHAHNLAESVGIEPTAHISTDNTLAGCRFKPLIQLSIIFLWINSQTIFSIKQLFFNINNFFTISKINSPTINQISVNWYFFT